MICSLCAAENPIDGRYCSKRGALLQGQPGLPPQPGHDATPAAPYTGPKETSGKAIGSLICGLIFFFFPSSVGAIILGHLALSDIRHSAGRLTGRGMAIGGLVMGYAGVSLIPILIIAAIAIPNLLLSRIAANEASAVGSLRMIVTAAYRYRDSYSNGYPPSLSAMGGSGPSCDHAASIASELASGRRNGYVFTYVAVPAEYNSRTPQSPQAVAAGCTVRGGTSFTISADPITRGTTGQRSFYSDRTGVLHFSVKGPATAASPIME
jgi:type IV pilus assembly protein PilA